MLLFVKALGIKAVERDRMSLATLRESLDRGHPVLIALQAWAEDTIDTSIDYTTRWEDGHYVVAIGYDEARVFFMDPSTLGHYTYLPNEALLARWHDYYNPVEGSAERIDLHQWGIEFVATKNQFNTADAIHYLG